MIGAHIHRIRRLADFTPQEARQAAQLRWLTDAEYLAILLNPRMYTLLQTQENPLVVDPTLIFNGGQECLYLCDCLATDNINYTVVEELANVAIGGGRYMNFRRSYTLELERREYLPRSAGNKLVHYRQNTDPVLHDIVNGTNVINQVMDDMDNDSQVAANRRRAIAAAIRGEGGQNG